MSIVPPGFGPDSRPEIKKMNEDLNKGLDRVVKALEKMNSNMDKRHTLLMLKLDQTIEFQIKTINALTTPTQLAKAVLRTLTDEELEEIKKGK